jgi:hypothetical protein
MRMASDIVGKTPEVATNIRTRNTFNAIQLIEAMVVLPRFVVGLIAT